MHVHDPESSVLELWLLDRGDWGAIPQSMRDIFGSTGGHALVGSSKVLLSQVAMSKVAVGPGISIFVLDDGKDPVATSLRFSEPTNANRGVEIRALLGDRWKFQIPPPIC